MVVEARYAPGNGVLIGAGDHWVLVTDPGDEDVIAAVWDVLSAPGTLAPLVAEQVLAIVERAFDGAPPALAFADCSPGSSTTIARGTGQVRHSGPTRVLSLTGPGSPTPRPTRRLVGGVTNASVVEVSPLKGPVRAAGSPSAVAAPPAPAAGLIDGIPAEILAATGPAGPPPTRARKAPPQWESAEDTGSSSDTTEPDPESMERIEEGGHTTIRAPHPVPDDHDGSTVHRPAHLVQDGPATVLAVACPQGHLTPAAQPSCRVCHQRIAPQEPRLVQRPTLGGLRLPTGEVVPLDRGVVLGRKPAPVEGSRDWPHLVHLPANHSFVSRMHLQIELDGWDVVARDLNTRGGTTVTPPGRQRHRMTPGDAYVLEPGTTLDLAEVYEVRFEAGPVAPR